MKQQKKPYEIFDFHVNQLYFDFSQSESNQGGLNKWKIFNLLKEKKIFSSLDADESKQYPFAFELFGSIAENASNYIFNHMDPNLFSLFSIQSCTFSRLIEYPFLIKEEEDISFKELKNLDENYSLEILENKYLLEKKEKDFRISFCYEKHQLKLTIQFLDLISFWNDLVQISKEKENVKEFTRSFFEEKLNTLIKGLPSCRLAYLFVLPKTEKENNLIDEKMNKLNHIENENKNNEFYNPKNNYVYLASKLVTISSENIHLITENILESLELISDPVERDKIFSLIWVLWEIFFKSAKNRITKDGDFASLKKENYWEHKMKLSTFLKHSKLKQDSSLAVNIKKVVDVLMNIKVKSFLNGNIHYLVLFPRFSLDLINRKVTFLFHPVIASPELWAIHLSSSFFQEYKDFTKKQKIKSYRDYSNCFYKILLFYIGPEESISKSKLEIPIFLKDKKFLSRTIQYVNNSSFISEKILVYNQNTKTIEKKDRKNIKQKQNGDTLDTQ